MKKNLFKSMLLGVAALATLNLSAENRVWVADYDTFEEVTEVSMAPGETHSFILGMDYDTPFTSAQFTFESIPGITLDFVDPDGLMTDDRDDTWPYYMRGSRKVFYSYQTSFNEEEPSQLMIVFVTLAGSDAAFRPDEATGMGHSYLIQFDLKADESFLGGDLVLSLGKTDYNEGGGTEPLKMEITNQQVCKLSLPVAGTPLATIVAEGVDNTEYTVLEDLQIVQKAPKAGCVFVTDGNGNWMKVAAEGDVYTAIEAMDDIKGGTLTGVLSEANCNQVLTVTKAPTETNVHGTVAPAAWNLAPTGTEEEDPHYHFAPKVNEVIALTGYWYAPDNAFRAYYNAPRGQSATANFEWCNTDATMVNNQLYKDVVCAVQLKAPWTAPAGAPAKVAANDNLAFQNYLVYPMAVEETNIATGVDDLTVGKDVVSVQYINVAGQMSSTPFEGVNMVVTRYADGSQKTIKVVK